MTCTHKRYDDSKNDDRRKAVDGAITSQRLEGLELDPATLSDFDDFSDGCLNLQEVRERIEARFGVVKQSISFEI